MNLANLNSRPPARKLEFNYTKRILEPWEFFLALSIIANYEDIHKEIYGKNIPIIGTSSIGITLKIATAVKKGYDSLGIVTIEDSVEVANDLFISVGEDILLNNQDDTVISAVGNMMLQAGLQSMKIDLRNKYAGIDYETLGGVAKNMVDAEVDEMVLVKAINASLGAMSETLMVQYMAELVDYTRREGGVEVKNKLLELLNSYIDDA